MIKYLALFLLFPVLLWSQEISLKERLVLAKAGHYLVTEQNKNFTFLHISETMQERIVMEEITIPAARCPQKPMRWREWFESGAPGHTSWIQSQINIASGKCEESYSIPHQAWIDTSATSHFMAALLNLNFSETPNVKRRRVGPAPGYGKFDSRPLWNPRLVVNGQPHPNVPFQAWRARWPADGSEMARRTIEVYLPEATSSTYPTYFPYWLEVEGKIGSVKIRVIDSGMDAKSLKPAMPHRPPKMIGKVGLNQEGLILRFQNSSYFDEFILMAEEADSPLGKIIPLVYHSRVENDIISLEVSKDELDKSLISGERYRFMIWPKTSSMICIETDPISYL